MPYYLFRCFNNHEQERSMSFAEHEKLDKEPGVATYVPCNVKYGDLDHPTCKHKAYQVFDKNVGLLGFHK